MISPWKSYTPFDRCGIGELGAGPGPLSDRETSMSEERSHEERRGFWVCLSC